MKKMYWFQSRKSNPIIIKRKGKIYVVKNKNK